MKTYIIICLSFISCTSKIERPQIEGNVYDKLTNQAIMDAEIFSFDKKGFLKAEAHTDKSGHFTMDKITSREVFAFESGNDPKVYTFIIKHLSYGNDTIEERARGSFNDYIKKYDSIFLVPFKK